MRLKASGPSQAAHLADIWGNYLVSLFSVSLNLVCWWYWQDLLIRRRVGEKSPVGPTLQVSHVRSSAVQDTQPCAHSFCMTTVLSGSRMNRPPQPAEPRLFSSFVEACAQEGREAWKCLLKLTAPCLEGTGAGASQGAAEPPVSQVKRESTEGGTCQAMLTRQDASLLALVVMSSSLLPGLRSTPDLCSIQIKK